MSDVTGDFAAVYEPPILIASDRPPIVGTVALIDPMDYLGATDATAVTGTFALIDAVDSLLATQNVSRVEIIEAPDVFTATGYTTVKPSFVPGRPVSTVPVAEPPLVKRPLVAQRTLPEPTKTYDPVLARAHNEQVLAHLNDTLSSTQGNDGIPVRDKKTGKLYMLEIHDGEIVKTYLQG